jgi:succinate dehydrogenase hydrophobic anchor subunit
MACYGDSFTLLKTIQFHNSITINVIADTTAHVIGNHHAFAIQASSALLFVFYPLSVISFVLRVDRISMSPTVSTLSTPKCK